MRDAPSGPLRSQVSAPRPVTAPSEKVKSCTYRASCTNQAKAKAPLSSLGVPAAPPAATPYTSAARSASSRSIISPTAYLNHRCAWRRGCFGSGWGRVRVRGGRPSESAAVWTPVGFLVVRICDSSQDRSADPRAVSSRPQFMDRPFLLWSCSMARLRRRRADVVLRE